VGKAPASALGKEEKGDGDHGGSHSGQTQQEVKPHVLLWVEAHPQPADQHTGQQEQGEPTQKPEKNRHLLTSQKQIELSVQKGGCASVAVDFRPVIPLKFLSAVKGELHGINQAEGGQPAGLFRFGGAEMGPEVGQNIQGKRDGFFQQKVGDGGLGQSAVFEHGQADGQEAGAELLPRGAAWGGLSGVTAELRRHDLIHGRLEQGVLGMEAVVDHG